MLPCSCECIPLSLGQDPIPTTTLLEDKLLDPPFTHRLIRQPTFVSNDILALSTTSPILTCRVALDSFSFGFPLFSLLGFSSGKRKNSLDGCTETTIRVLHG